jgi:hypothetical protein
MSKESKQDELAERRSSRQRGMHDDQGETPQIGWKDTFAMIIAAYQILLPMLFAIIGALLVAYLIFRFLFS